MAYKVPKDETDLIHVELEKQLFDRTSGKKVSNSFVQKFDKVAWANVKKNLTLLGYSRIEILHPTNDPEAAIDAPLTEKGKPVLDDLGRPKTVKMLVYNTSLPEKNVLFSKPKAKAKTPPAGDDLV